MLNPVKRFKTGRIPAVWRYPAAFDNSCSLLVEEDSAVIVWKDNRIYKKITEHGIYSLKDCPEDVQFYFIYVKEYPLIFNIKSETGDVMYDKIEIQIMGPEEFLNSVMAIKSIVTAAAEIFIIQTLNEAINECESNVSIDTVNHWLKEKSVGFRVIDWKCVNKDENKSIRC